MIMCIHVHMQLTVPSYIGIQCDVEFMFTYVILKTDFCSPRHVFLI